MDTESEKIALELANDLKDIDLRTYFAQTQPLHVEIGSGKGTFLLQWAQDNPQFNCLGIEWAAKYYRYCIDRVVRWRLENVRMLRTDARELVGHRLLAGTVDVFHIYYPDPWPKKRHHKRRLLNRDSFVRLHHCLRTGGELRITTDHAGYFEWMREYLEICNPDGILFQEVPFIPVASADQGYWVGSNFEKKYRLEGRSTYRLALKKQFAQTGLATSPGWIRAGRGALWR